MGRLDGKVAIVTGMARGTGEEIVRVFAREGARVLGLDMLDERARAVIDDLSAGDTAAYRHCDVTSPSDWTGAVDEVRARWGRLDVLVNNAAILHLQPLASTPVDVFERVLKVNCVGPFLSVQACAPLMIESGGGSIVNIGSTDSISGVPTTGAYTASKFALRGLTKVVALEYGKHNIRCNIVCPGAGNPEMVTEFFANHGASVMSEVAAGRQRSIQPSPMNRPGRPVDVAPAALYFASDESSYCTGTELIVDGGLHAGMYVDVPGMFSTQP
jgi:3alpha(or 20beta)-hydroxysteroid dehydrogenase